MEIQFTFSVASADLDGLVVRNEINTKNNGLRLTAYK